MKKTQNHLKYHTKYYLALLGFMTLAANPFQANAQVYAETATLFSQSRFGGTARFQGLAGANTALGGDISSGFSNPAGLGFNRKNEISFSPSGSYAFSDSDYYVFIPDPNDPNGGSDVINESTDNRLSLVMDHFGITIADERLGTKGAFKGGAFSFSYSRTNDFNDRYSYEGVSPEHSIVDYINAETQGIPSFALADETSNGTYIDIAALAYANYIMNPLNGDEICADGSCNPAYFDDKYGTFAFEPMRQSETVTTKGGQRSMNFSYGANFFDKIYVGASLGIESIRYIQEKKYREEAIDQLFELSSIEFDETTTIKGTGANIKIGAIFRPINILRLGITFTSPTVYQIEDTYEATLRTNFNSNSMISYYYDGSTDILYEEDIELPQQSFESSLVDESGEEGLYSTYTMYTPFRAEVGAALFLGKMGFISADVEYVAYNTTRLSNEELPEFFDEENEFIKNNINPAININLGAEFRFFKKVYFRGGVAYYGDPSNELGDIERAGFHGSLGTGIRTSKFYIDFTLSGTNKQTTAIPYNVESNNSPLLNSFTTVNNNKIRGLASIGFFF